MSTEKYLSEIRQINFPVEKVYNRLSDLRNIEKLINPDKLRQVKDKIPGAPEINIENFNATENECTFDIKSFGNIGIMIVEKEPNKTIKLTGSKTVPFDFYCWLQLLPVNPESCKLRITLHAELNPMIKMMVSKTLEEGVNYIAEALTRINYD
jgi:hypothetical protein